MNISGSVITFVCMYMILPIVYFMMRNLSKPKKNIVLGVTLPLEARQEQSVLTVCRSYRKHLTFTCLVLTVLSLGAFFLKHSSTVMAYLLTWLLAAIIAPVVSYAIYHRKLKRIKHDNNWVLGTAGKIMLDTRVSAQMSKRLSAWMFAPSVAISVIPLIHDVYSKNGWYMAPLYGTVAVLTACCYLFYLMLYRQKAEVVDSDTGLSMALTQVRRYNWGKFWIVFSWATALFNLGLWLFIWNNAGILIVSAAYLAIVLFVAINAEFSTRKAQENLTAASGRAEYVDDDRHWLLGMFYYNQDDRHIIINARVGINTTLNMAHPVGKVVMGLSLLLLLAMPFFGLWMISEEFTPVHLTITDTSIESRHTALAYSIPLYDVRSAELLEALPPAIRIAGTGMDKLLKGKFRVEGPGLCSLCLDPQTPPFILIQTAEKNYIFGTNDSEETRANYSMLEGKL